MVGKILLAILMLVVGFVLMVKGADWFVDGAAGIAAKMRIPSLVIGLTIVAFGTSAPELASSTVSTLSDSAGIAIGNVLGSNICNVLLILGISSIVAVLPVQKDSLLVDLPLLVVASGVIVLFGVVGNEIGRIEGAIMVCALVAYTIFLIVGALRKRKKQSLALENHDVVSEEESKKGFKGWYEKMKKYTLFLGVVTVVGLAMVVGGGVLAVNGAKTIAAKIGIPEKIVGVTIVAIGTSLPELITSVVAAKKGETDIAVGNIIGSNIFNILMVAGVAAIIKPMAFDGFFVDGIIALVAVVVLAFFAYLPGHKLRRWMGVILVTGAVAYYVYAVVVAIASMV